MTLTPEQQASMLEAAKPLIAWMHENTHLHCTALVTDKAVKVMEGIAMASATKGPLWAKVEDGK